MDDYKVIAALMFAEFNEVADEYNISRYNSESDIETVLRDNFTEDDVARMRADPTVRLILSGVIAGLMEAQDLANSMVIIEPMDGADETQH